MLFPVFYKYSNNKSEFTLWCPYFKEESHKHPLSRVFMSESFVVECFIEPKLIGMIKTEESLPDPSIDANEFGTIEQHIQERDPDLVELIEIDDSRILELINEWEWCSPNYDEVRRFLESSEELLRAISAISLFALIWLVWWQIY